MDGFFIGLLLFVLGVLAALGIGFKKFYRHANKETSLVRTGLGGEKIVISGGVIVLPIFHQAMEINMQTITLEISCEETESLLTRDHMRIDLVAQFFVRVRPGEVGIETAAQTLGTRTHDRNALKEVLEGKLINALRAIAAKMDMEELHSKRLEFIRDVHAYLKEELDKTGLDLENIAITHLNQTDKEFFNINNAFDAQGLTRLTEMVELHKKKQNDAEQDSAFARTQKNLQTERDQQYAQMAQELDLAVRRAEQAAAIAEEEAAKEREAEEARIAARREVELARIAAERDIENERIRKTQAVELAEQERTIAIAEKSRAESEAKAAAEKSRAEAVREEEGVITVRETERAERSKAIELIAAEEAAQKEAIAVTVSAEAEKQAALDRAEAARIAAQGETDAKILLAQAQEKQYQVEAEGTRAVNEAANALSDEQIAMQIRLALLKRLPDIIRESVRPMENIDDIKILQVNGLGGFGGTSGSPKDGGHADNLADQMVNSALRYRGQAPLVDSLLKEIGLDGSNINGLTQGLHHSVRQAAEALQGETPALPAAETVTAADDVSAHADAPQH
ncbi:flotillin family protein [Conchiformibius kuhniae]|uniref:Flotillin family protein n=1 Tax=Conchiformibius kuhniae TaxID=211502 RepID=A0ABD8B8B8_9NEIS|nr:flotillin domain-containing protein [Conchiformibius kuhniae]